MSDTVSRRLKGGVYAAPKSLGRRLGGVTAQVVNSSREPARGGNDMEVDHQEGEVQIKAHGEVITVSPRGAGSPQSVKFAVKKDPNTGQLEEIAAEVQWFECKFDGCEGTPEAPCGQNDGKHEYYCGPCSRKNEKEREWFRQQQDVPWPRESLEQWPAQNGEPSGWNQHQSHQGGYHVATGGDEVEEMEVSKEEEVSES